MGVLRPGILGVRIDALDTDIYASQATYAEVSRAFPYLVSKEFASGGGDVCQAQLGRNPR